MAILESLVTYVGLGAAKFLAKRWVTSAAEATGLLDKDIAGEMAAGGMDLLKDKFKKVTERNEAERQFQRIGEKIAERLEPLFQQEVKRGLVQVEEIARELGVTLSAHVSPKLLVEKDLDPAVLTTLLRNARPVERGTFSESELAFYDRALEEAVRYVVSTASALPRFQEALAAENLKRIGRIDADLDKVLEITERIERRIVGSNADATARFKADYCHAVSQNLDYLELFGADIPPEARRHSLSVAYVSLNLQRHDQKKGQPDDTLPAEAVLNDLRPDGGRLLIRGEAGSGKSTLFRWAAIIASEPSNVTFEAEVRDVGGGWVSVTTGSTHVFSVGAPSDFKGNKVRVRRAGSVSFEAQPGELGDSVWFYRIPFLILLRDCAGGKLPSPDDFPELIAKQAGHPPQGWVKEVLQAGRGLVLLDGVDEVANLDRNKLYGEIKALVDAFPQCYFLVSTRPDAVEEGWLNRLGFREAAINPMSPVDREQFIDKWHDAVREELKRLSQPVDDLSSEADSLKQKLRGNATLARLATNPLMAAMICALHRRSKEHLPPREAALVERLCVMLLDERDRLSGLKPEAYVAAFRKLDYVEKKAVVQELAYHMLVNRGESALDRDEALAKVADRLGLLQQSPQDAADVLRALIERSGMLRERTPPRAEPGETVPARIDFLHNTFKEYLAGTRLALEGAVLPLAEHWDNSDWVPAILFASAAEVPGFATKLIQKLFDETEARLLGAHDKLGKRTKLTKFVRAAVRKRQLLALRCRAVGWEVDPALTARLRETEESLFPPRTMGEADALGEAGEAVLPFLKHLAYDPKRNAEQSAACIRALRLIGDEATQPILEGYLNEDRLSVLDELAQALNPLLIPAVQRMVQEPYDYEKFEKQQAIRKQITDLSPLAGLSGLTTLHLISTPVRDLSPLAGLSGLTTLDLRLTPVRDLSPLAGLSGLTTLDLVGTSVSDLSPLAGLSGLTTLNLYGTSVSDLSPLAGLSGLTTLDLSYTPVSDLSPLAKLSKLEVVWLDKNSDGFDPKSARKGYPADLAPRGGN